MNPQTIAIRANANHFGHAEAPRGQHLSEKAGKKRAAPRPAQAKMNTVAEAGTGTRISEEANVEPAAAVQTRTSMFRLNERSAGRVQLAGDFTGWKKSPVTMIRDKSGVWQASVFLKPGQYRYRFIVDGEWRDDPNCLERVSNPYESFDSVVHVS